MYCGLFLVVLGTRLVRADDPKFEYGKAEEVKDVKAVEWLATAEAGLVLTTGNSDTTAATGGLKVSRKERANKVSFEASGVYAKQGLRILLDKNGNGLIDDPSEIVSTSSLTTEMFASRLRYDRFLTELNSLFVAALAARNLPAGKESVIGAQAGYSRSLYKTKTAQTVAELGYDFSREDLITGEPLSIHSGRLFFGHRATMTAGTDVETALELLTNVNRETLPTGKDGGPLQDTRVNFKVAISAKIGKNLAVQTSLEARYDNRPGPLAIKNLAMGFVPEASSLDTIMNAQFIYTFTGAK
ncbi:MAG: hypothetical protein JWO36_5330 [Myxococcales bacterium]|nr:hypothetical protein [Myxococcales bacterium]